MRNRRSPARGALASTQGSPLPRSESGGKGPQVTRSRTSPSFLPRRPLALAVLLTSQRHPPHAAPLVQTCGQNRGFVRAHLGEECPGSPRTGRQDALRKQPSGGSQPQLRHRRLPIKQASGPQAAVPEQARDRLLWPLPRLRPLLF